MLKIFFDDVCISKFSTFLEKIKLKITEKIESDLTTENFIKNCLLPHNESISEMVDNIIGNIEVDGENVLQKKSDEDFPILKEYHNLYNFLVEFNKLISYSDKKCSRKDSYNHALEFLIEMNKIKENCVLRNYFLYKNYDLNNLSVEFSHNIDDKRVSAETKMVLFQEIKSKEEFLSCLFEDVIRLNEIFSYSNIEKERVELVECINIKTCVYCNINNLDVIENSKNGKKKAKYEFDHVLPKKLFPLFASSLWNLVPVCHTCNHNKKEAELSFNSWFVDLEPEILKIHTKISDKDILLNIINQQSITKDQISISFNESSPEYSKSIKILELEQLYNGRIVNGDLEGNFQHIFRSIRGYKNQDYLSMFSENKEKLFFELFKINLSDLKKKHYSAVLYGKVNSDLLNDLKLDLSSFDQ